MIPFRRVLFPVDYSDSCKATVPYVLDMLSRFDGELTLLRAYVAYPAIYGDPAGMMVSGWPAPAQIRDVETKAIDEFANTHFPGRKVTKLLVDGEPGSEIAEAVKSHQIDLVMMPTKGQGSLRRLLLGSTTAKVLHDVGCAVWTGVHEHVAEHTLDLPYRTILCAVSTDDRGETLLRSADAFARAYNAKLEIVHAIEIPQISAEIDYGPYRKDVVDSARRAIRHLKDETGLEVPTHLEEGPTPSVVRRVATNIGADLLIVGRGHSQDAIAQVWSELYPLIREAPCPVLSV